MRFFTKLKDKAIAFAAKTILRKKIERYGTMLDLNIDSKANQIFIRVSLKGEAEPLEITVNKYSFVTEPDGEYIVIDDINISKEWMNLIADDFLDGKKFKLPAGFASKVIKMLM